MWNRASRDKSPDIPTIGFMECPAKTFMRPDGQTVLGRSVVEHCQIVGEVARELIDRYPKSLRCKLFPNGSEFAAAAHDIGKVSPYFVEKIRRACTVAPPGIALLTGVNPALESDWGGHAGVSQVTAKALGAPEWVPEILGQHHGFSPVVRSRRASDDVFGGDMWQTEREALVTELQTRLRSTWPFVSSLPVARLLAGLASVSDWIGSGKHFEDPEAPWQTQVKAALDEAGFIQPIFRSNLSFAQVFGFSPHDSQQSLINAVTAPGVYVLEAPMGLGKTEAALYAAYQMLQAGHATGVYFALPTRLTSNKIHERFSSFLDQILVKDSQLRPLLLHANAWLMDTEMGEDGRPGGSWFNHSKRGLLAPFAVGTIDQALMAAMNVKHGFVRAFGLAGKVVILDEVHTYDAYTGTLLDALVELLRALNCTVIILSATLAKQRRQLLLGTASSSDAYPLITAIPSGCDPQEFPCPISAMNKVEVRLVREEASAVQEALDRALQGQQVLWIENTVAEAQQRYLDLAARAAELGLGCGLLHSRFNSDDRQRLEDDWVNAFGKVGWLKRAQQGRILIGTQVLEQSLDIDADFLVSRFAPTDMLLQRIGRLWRHAQTPRATSANCEAWLIAPDLDQAVRDPPQSFGNSAYVYSPYVLCRSLEVWQHLGSLSLPTDIRVLIELTYLDRDEVDSMARWRHELENGTPRRKGRTALRQLARVALAEAGETLPESKAQTRYSETESHDVLLLRAMMQIPERKTYRLTLLSGEQVHLPQKRHQLDKQGWRKLSALLMRQTVAVRPQDAPLPLSISALEKFGLQNCFYLGNPQMDEAILRIALVDDTDVLQGLNGASVHEKCDLKYRNDLGYQVTKK